MYKINTFSFSRKFLENLSKEKKEEKIKRRIRNLLSNLKNGRYLLDNSQANFSTIVNLIEATSFKDSKKNNPPNIINENLRYYLFWHFNEKLTRDAMQQQGIAMTNNENLKKFIARFFKDRTINFDNIRERDENNIVKYWNSDIINYFCTSKKIILYDAYLMKNKNDRDYNLKLFLENIQRNSNNKYVFIITKRENEEQDFLDYFNKIQKAAPTINLVVYVKYMSDLGLGRFILTDYFYVNANHAFQSVGKNNKVKVRSDPFLNFLPLLVENDDEELINDYQNIYYDKVNIIKNLFINFNGSYGEPYDNSKDQIYCTIKEGEIERGKEKEKILEILNSF